MIFRIAEITLKGKDLERFLYLCQPYVISMSVPHPMENADLVNGHLKAKTASGTSYELFYKHLMDNNIREFTKAQLIEWMPSIGRKPVSAGNVLEMLQKSKKIKRGSKRGIWRIA